MSVYAGPEIVNDNLVFNLDAANKRSYPGSGTIWYDLSGNITNGTLTNGPTFDNNNNGSFIFDGVDDRVDCGTNFSTYLSGTLSFAIECFCYPENSQPAYADLWGNHTDNFTGIVFQQNNNVLNQYTWGWGTGSSWSNTSGLFYLNTQKWNHVVAVRNSSTIITYLNGIVVDTKTNMSGTLAPNASFNFQIGTGYNLTSGRKFKGKISSFRIYNRALTATEIQQNFNAFRGRFEI